MTTAKSLLRDNLELVRERIARACDQAGRDPDEVTIIAVTKAHPVDAMHAAVEAGLLDLGENRVQEALGKIPDAPPAARIHLIGHLQSNKVNKAVGAFASIASVDREDLLEKIANRAVALGLVQPVWIQVNITAEPQKAGCEPEACPALWRRAVELDGARPIGLMGISRFSAPESEVRGDFARLRVLADPLTAEDGESARLSMGMSDDFEWAILEGATHVRLGTVLFGPRT
jgi:pyridoxal phosphate enzyme (YggS family)